MTRSPVHVRGEKGSGMGGHQRGYRGKVHPAIAYDGRYQMHVDGWENPCGHVDKYAAVEQEGYRS